MPRVIRTFAYLFASLLLSPKLLAEPTPTVPRVHLDFWNEEDTVERNNCYNYATNRATNTYAQPGEASDQTYEEYSCESVAAAAAADLGVEPTEFFPYTGRNDATLIALVVRPGRDFHWYRRDSSRYWSHKMGTSPATTLDLDDERIPSPETANRGPYVDFCGYFKVRSYPVSDDQQNSGYVRIGAMRRLPSLSRGFFADQPLTEAVSEVELQIYSGRQNPRLPLRVALQNDQLKTLLERVSSEVGNAVAVEKKNDLIKSDFDKPVLGQSRLAIIDHEGLIFPIGAKVTFGARGFSIRLDGDTFFAEADVAVMDAISRSSLSLHASDTGN